MKLEFCRQIFGKMTDRKLNGDLSSSNRDLSSMRTEGNGTTKLIVAFRNVANEHRNQSLSEPPSKDSLQIGAFSCIHHISFKLHMSLRAEYKMVGLVATIVRSSMFRHMALNSSLLMKREGGKEVCALQLQKCDVCLHVTNARRLQRTGHYDVETKTITVSDCPNVDCDFFEGVKVVSA
jgi:hypothetical protein